MFEDWKWMKKKKNWIKKILIGLCYLFNVYIRIINIDKIYLILSSNSINII